MSSQNHSNLYGAADIERYLQGKMTASEMHALEKAALEDPFLADALEGYQHAVNPADEKATLEKRLQARIAEDKNEKKIIALPSRNFGWLKIAAIFIIVGAAGYFIYNQSDDRKKNEVLAKIDTQTEQTAAETDTLQSTVDSISVADLAKTSTDLVTENQNNKGVVTETPGLASTLESKDNNKEDNTDSKFGTYLQDLSVNEPKEESRDLQTEAANTGTVTGTVVNEKGEVIPGAIVANSNYKVGTDSFGRFKLPVSDSSNIASIKAIGYDSRTMYNVMPSSDQFVVVMDKDKAATKKELAEVVTTSAYKRKKQTNAASQATSANALSKPNLPDSSAIPVGGWDAFRQYIVQSKKPLVGKKGEALTGKIGLSFKVDQSGNPFKIRIDRSLCKTCDDQAESLLKNGPKWRYSGKKRISVEIEM